MKLLVLISELGVLVSTIYYLAAIVAGLLFAHRSNTAPPPLPKIPPRVAILKPLRGVSEHLRENVISFLEIAYARVEYIFGVASYEDRAIDVPVSLRAPYQFANMTVIVGDEPGYCNRKVAKLVKMAGRAADKTDIFVLSDADISVEPDHLKRVVSELTANEKIGLVTCIYRGRAYASFASKMEALFINTDFAPQVILAEALEPMHYALGATIAVKREALQAIGGFDALKDLLADDFHLGSKVSAAGYKIELSSSIVTVACEDHDFSSYWARTYRQVRPLSLATIFIHGPFWALVYMVASRFSFHAFDVLAMVLGLRMLMATIMIGKVLKQPQPLTDALLIPFKDLVMTAIYFASLTGKTVKWGGRKFQLLPGGVMRELA